jgi:hypothetical protein
LRVTWPERPNRIPYDHCPADTGTFLAGLHVRQQVLVERLAGDAPAISRAEWEARPCRGRAGTPACRHAIGSHGPGGCEARLPGGHRCPCRSGR